MQAVPWAWLLCSSEQKAGLAGKKGQKLYFVVRSSKSLPKCCWGRMKEWGHHTGETRMQFKPLFKFQAKMSCPQEYNPGESTETQAAGVPHHNSKWRICYSSNSPCAHWQINSQPSNCQEKLNRNSIKYLREGEKILLPIQSHLIVLKSISVHISTQKQSIRAGPATLVHTEGKEY